MIRADYLIFSELLSARGLKSICLLVPLVRQVETPSIERGKGSERVRWEQSLSDSFYLAPEI